MELSSTPPPPKKNKNLTKLFYTLNKTPLGKTGCLSNLYYLLDAQASSFLIHSPSLNTVSLDTFRTLKKSIFKIVPSNNTFLKLFSLKTLTS